MLNEYMSAVNPAMPKITIEAFDSSLHETGYTRIIPLDLSQALVTQMRILDIQFVTAN